MAKLDFKYYIKDKLSFSSYFRSDFSRSFSFCKSCYMRLSAGESFIQNNLKTNIGALSAFVIPKFLFDVEMTAEGFRRLAENAMLHFNTVKSFKGINDFYGKLKEYIENEAEQNTFILNILFYKRHQSEMKVLKLIKDVPPARLTELIVNTNEVGALGRTLIRESPLWDIDLGKIYYLTPVKTSGRGDPTTYKELLELYSAIFSGGSVSYSAMIRQFVEVIRIYRFEKFGAYNIGRPNNPISGMTAAVMQSNLLLVYLKRLRLLKGVSKMPQTDVKSLDLGDERMEEFLSKIGYNDPQTALFLLGRLIAEVGRQQRGKEPILEKINYQGMDAKRLLRLTNEVFEKLKQYKVLKYNKSIFAACKSLLDKDIQNWQLDDQENVFYILSGYSYRGQRAATTSETAEEEENENDTEE